MLDPDSMEYHAKIEGLKRMASECMIEGGVDPTLLDEDDLMLVLKYFDDVCQQMSKSDDPEQIIPYLLKTIIVNVALVIIKAREVEELKG